jgi:hypothetical protein
MPINTSLISGTVAHTHGLASADGGYLLDGTTGVNPFGVYPFGTSNPMIKVSKTFADIDPGSASMDIYTLAQDGALVNVYADITSVFDLSTAVTIGDSADDNGFQEATDWTAGTGLTDATRGVYVTSFKNMLSTSGTTDIKAYNFTTVTSGGSTFTQSSTNDSRTIQNSGRQELAQQMNTGQVLVGEDIRSASFFIKIDAGTPAGTIRAFIRQSDGTLIQQSSDTLDAGTLTASYVEYSFAFPGTTLSAGDMITISGGDMSSGNAACQTQTSEMSNGKLYSTNSTGSSYSQLVANEMKMSVGYGTVTTTSDTTGEIDFYLQVVD